MNSVILTKNLRIPKSFGCIFCPDSSRICVSCLKLCTNVFEQVICEFFVRISPFNPKLLILNYEKMLVLNFS